jgi:hypothetical protein
MIVPPVIIDERGDITLFSTASAAALKMEPVDVLNAEYDVYDSEGQVLSPVVTNDGRRVDLVELERPRYAPETLRTHLQTFIEAVGPERVGVTGEEVRHASLARLVEILSSFELRSY